MTTHAEGRFAPELDLLSIVYVGDDDERLAELSRLADLVGLDFTRLAAGETRRAGVLTFSSEGLPPYVVKAQFHDLFAPYFARGQVRLHVRDDAADILELMAAVGATVRGKVIGVLGAHGGVGVTTIAAWLARLLAKGDESVALLDLNPASAGLELRLGIVDEPGKRWADMQGSGAVLAGRVNSSLPLWNKVRVLSGDNRGAPPIDAEAGARVIAALSQVNSWTILDFGPLVARPDSVGYGWLGWCDHLLLLTRADQVSLMETSAKLGDLVSGPPLTVVAMGVSSQNEAAHVADILGLHNVISVRQAKGNRGDIDHGVRPGDRQRSGVARDLVELADHCVSQVP